MNNTKSQLYNIIYNKTTLAQKYSFFENADELDINFIEVFEPDLIYIYHKWLRKKKLEKINSSKTKK